MIEIEGILAEDQEVEENVLERKRFAQSNGLFALSSAPHQNAQNFTQWETLNRIQEL